MAELRSLATPGTAAALWAISVDTAAQSRAFADEIAADGRGRVAFPMLSDPDHRVIDTYGLRDPRYARTGQGAIPYPAVLVIDRAGRVAWSRVEKDYRQRPSVAEIRAAIEAAK